MLPVHGDADARGGQDTIVGVGQCLTEANCLGHGTIARRSAEISIVAKFESVSQTA
jgi:hypothetical protein